MPQSNKSGKKTRHWVAPRLSSKWQASLISPSLCVFFDTFAHQQANRPAHSERGLRNPLGRALYARHILWMSLFLARHTFSMTHSRQDFHFDFHFDHALPVCYFAEHLAKLAVHIRRLHLISGIRLANCQCYIRSFNNFNVNQSTVRLTC